MPDDTICVVLNAGSGSGDAEEQVRQIGEAMGRHGCKPVFRRVTAGHNIEGEAHAAVAEGHDIIVAAGGDGTITAVATALVGSGRRMGVIPLGTFNYVARSLGLPPDDLDAAVAAICGPRSAPLRAARLNDTVFLNNASFGVYPVILVKREEVYSRWGRSRVAAYWSVVKTLATLRRPLQAAITIDGQRRQMRTPLIFVVNNAYQIEALGLEGADRIGKGELVAFVAPDGGRLAMFRHALALALGRAAPGRSYEVLSGREMVIELAGRTREGRSVAIDGELHRLPGPFRIAVIDDALRVMVPEDWSDTPR